ncbi:hypothetical protein Tco_1108184 [Tanacetum coccineum]
MAEPILNEAQAEQNLAKPSIESNVKYELGEELLKELRRNTYSGKVEEDVVGHIAKILEVPDLIKIAGVDPDKVDAYKMHRRGLLIDELQGTKELLGNRNRDALRRNAPVDTSTTHVLVVQDEIDGSSSSSSSESESISAKDKKLVWFMLVIERAVKVISSVFNSRESDVDDNPVNDRFKTSEGFHAVPPPYTGNYMAPRPDLSFVGLDESILKSAMRKTTTSVPETNTSISKTSKDIIEKPKTVRPSALIIEE